MIHWLKNNEPYYTYCEKNVQTWKAKKCFLVRVFPHQVVCMIYLMYIYYNEQRMAEIVCGSLDNKKKGELLPPLGHC